MVVVTEWLIQQKAKNTNTRLVTKLNLVGSDLDDISILSRLPNLKVLSLSVNNISSIAPLAECQQLSELYLRQNRISDLQQLYPLRNLNQLEKLSLIDNPCTMRRHYRKNVIALLPQLKILDDQPISQDEKIEARNFEQQGHQSPIVPTSQSKSRGQDAQYQQQDMQNNVISPKQRREMNSQDQEDQYGAFDNGGWRANMEAPHNFNQGAPEFYAKEQGRQYATISRDENILCAILSLMKELDPNSLELVRKEAENLMAEKL